MTNHSPISEAVGLLPELKAKLPDVNAVEWRDYRVISKSQLETIIAALEALTASKPEAGSEK